MIDQTQNNAQAVLPEPPAWSSTPKKRSPRAIAVIGIVVVLAAVAAVILLGQRPSALEKAAKACNTTAVDGGSTISVAITDSDFAGFATWECVVSEVPVPAYVQDGLGNASAMGGPVSMTWDSFTATSSYSGVSGEGMFTIHEG